MTEKSIFLERVRKAGGEYLVRYVQAHGINDSRKLLASLLDHQGNLEALAKRSEERDESTKALLGQFEGLMPEGFSTKREELDFVQQLIPKVRQEFGVT